MTSATAQADPFLQQLHAIEQAIAQRDLQAAALQLNAAVKLRPADPRVYLLGSRMAEAAGNAKGAEESARNAVEVAPEWSFGLIELAFLLARQNQFAEAIAQATKAVALAPQDLDILTRAIDIAHRAQHLAVALPWLRKAAALAPAHLQFKQLIARDLAALGQHNDAVAAYTELLASTAGPAQNATGHPDPAPAAANPAEPAQGIASIPDEPLIQRTQALMGRARAYLALGELAQALQDCNALVALEPANEEFVFWQTIARGLTPRTQPMAMVRAMHDGFAELYDQHMVRSLHYQLPKKVGDRLLEIYPDKKFNLLDLGCGTGLVGVCVGRIDGALIGVDFSTKMVEQAIRQGVYDRFHTVNLLDALEATPEWLYEVITACDVFIYVGELTQVVPDAFRVLRPGGRFIFSCETAGEDEADLVLRTTMRYAHKQSHIETLCMEAGFDSVQIESTHLRTENGQPVHGYVVTAHKPVQQQA